MNIARLEQVLNLRAIWDVEPRFSDWLASEEGLEVVARDLEVQIENARREVRPGDYPCDIVGNILGDENHVVIIENQFGRTDHDHLGKLMTYAAVNRATTAVWIAEEASDDHRKVIDWLNDNTPPHLNFFLACVRAFRIGDSPVAPQLEVVSRPNLAVKVAQSGGSDAEKRLHEWRREFWSEIHSFIASQNPPFRLQSPSVDAWSIVAIGRSKFWLAMWLIPRRKCVRVELAMDVPWRRAAFDALKREQSTIETALGAPLVWQFIEEQKSARIFLETLLDPREEENQDAIKSWLYEKTLAFHRIFMSRVRDLQPPVETPVEEPNSEEL